MNNPSELLSIRATARFLNVHENTIRNWIDKGMLTAVIIPGPSGFRRLLRHNVEDLAFSISQKRKGIVKCILCGKTTTTLEASLRRFNRGYCGNCGEPLK